MKNLKIFVSLMAVMAMLMSCLAACNVPDNEPIDTSDAEETAEETAEEIVTTVDEESTLDTTEEEPEETTPEIDTEEEQTTEAAAETAESTTEETTLPRFDYFEATMADYVTIDPSAYESISVTLAADLQITDADVERYIMQLRYQKRESTTETETMVDEPLEWGDDAYIYYTGYLDGEPFEGGSNESSTKPSALGLGSGNFIPGFEDGLVGVIPSQTSKEDPVSISMRFPSGYQSSELAGKEVVFDVYVVYAVENTLPDYDVTFVEDVLKYDFKEDFYASDRARLAEFEEYVRDYLENSNASTVEEATFTALWKHLLEQATFAALPEEELAYYRHYYMSEFERMYEYYLYYGYDVGTFEEFVRVSMGLDKATGDWEAELERAVEENVRYDVLRYAIAEQEGMKAITDEEMDEEIQYWIDYYKNNYGFAVTRDEILENLGENSLRQSALSQKVNAFLNDRVVITYA